VEIRNLRTECSRALRSKIRARIATRPICWRFMHFQLGSVFVGHVTNVSVGHAGT
jgi:hypothetical protein